MAAKLIRVKSSWAVLAGLLAVAILPAILSAQALRRFTVRDSIEKAIFVADPFNKREAVEFSPDGRHFFVITKRGILQTNQIESTVWLFDSAAVMSFLKQASEGSAARSWPIVKMATVSNADPITDARWATDGESIALLGRNKNAERHLFVVNLRNGQVKQLSPDGQDVTAFDRAKETFVFTTVPLVNDSQLYQSGGPELPDIQHGTGLSIFGLLYPHWEDTTVGGHPRDLWHVRNGKAGRVTAPSGSAPVSLVSRNFGTMLSLSPSGRYVITTNAVAHVPPAWESYEAGNRFQTIVADKPGVKPVIERHRPTQYILIDLEGGKQSVLIDAPLGVSTAFTDAQVALWSRDEKEVLLSSVYLPLEGSSAGGLPHSRRPWVVAVNVESRKITPIRETPVRDETSRVRLTNLEWQAPDHKLALRYVDYSTEGALTEPAIEPELFERADGRWRAVTDKAAIDAAVKKMPVQEFSVAVRQSLNEPPVLVATDSKSGKSKKIFDPNPQLKSIQLGEAAVYKWHDKDGNEWSGGLVKPPDYIAGHRYPLVIQTHGFSQKEFLTDGGYPTAMSARPMAARGMLVLQVGGIPFSRNISSTPKEADVMREGYVAAIQQLDAAALIEPQRIGIIGFSRTGWYVLNSLLHARKYFAAATLAECTYISLGEYTLNADYGGPGRAKSIASALGAEPFGDGLQKWMSDSAGFNTNKLDMPILFQANWPVGLIYAWDMYALMRLQNKPVDLLYFRNGAHILSKPLERLVSQEMNVDWYDFWLNGHEDPDPAKADQYKRWRELRKIQQQNVTKSKEPNSALLR